MALVLLMPRVVSMGDFMAIIKNFTKEKCAKGEVTLGVIIWMSKSVDIGMMMKTCGYDWILLDTEHGAVDYDEAGQISIAALGQGITPIVRIPSVESHPSARILDMGAQGIVLPHVESAEKAREFVATCKYPPQGRRSKAGNLPQAGFEALPLGELLPALNRETLLITMIETPEAAEKADEIAAVEGIDILLIGTNDLCIEMGIPGQPDHEKVEAVYERVISACKRHGKTAGMAGAYAPSLVERRIREGVRFVLGGADSGFMMASAKAQVEALRKIQP